MRKSVNKASWNIQWEVRSGQKISPEFEELKETSSSTEEVNEQDAPPPVVQKRKRRRIADYE